MIVSNSLIESTDAWGEGTERQKAVIHMWEQGILGAMHGRRWYKQVVSPHTHDRHPQRRQRMFWVGIDGRRAGR